MIKLRSSVLWIAMAVAFLLGMGFRSVLAQQSAAAGQSTQNLPPSVLASSLGRIPWPPKADCCPLNTEEEREAYAKSNATAEAQGKPPSIGVAGMRAYFPLASALYGQYTAMLEKESKVEPRYIQLAAVMGARGTSAKGIYREWFIHTAGARQAGVSEDIIEVIRTGKDAKGLPEKDAALIRFGREMAAGTGVSLQTFQEMERLFGRRGTLQIAFQVMRYHGLALMSKAYDIQLEPGQKAPW